MILNPVIQGGGGGANLVTATLDFEPKNGVTYTFLDENGTPKQIDGTGVYSMQAGILIAEFDVSRSSPFFSGDISQIKIIGQVGAAYHVNGDFRIY